MTRGTGIMSHVFDDYGPLKGEIPGEEILIKRMLWEVIERAPYLQGIHLDKMLFFEEDKEGGGGAKPGPRATASRPRRRIRNRYGGWQTGAAWARAAR